LAASLHGLRSRPGHPLAM